MKDTFQDIQVADTLTNILIRYTPKILVFIVCRQGL